MTAQWLNTIGLVLGMLGVGILFQWGPPQPDFDEGIAMGISFTKDTVFTDGTKPSEIVAAAKKRKRQHQLMSRFGLGLVGLGFLVQLVAVWLPSTTP
jgi:hypothetical protein